MAALLAAACARQPEAAVERLHVELALRKDGGVEARERWRVRVDGDRFRIRRPLDRHDEIVDVTALVDGAPAPGGSAPGHADVGRGDGVDVEWRVRAPGTYDLELRYRAAGAVAVRGVHAALSWSILPAGRAFDIAAASVTLSLPSGTHTSAEPYVEDGSGWTVEREGATIRAQARGLSAERAPTLVVPFFVDPQEIEEPIWQRDAARARDLLPAFISGGLFVLVIVAGAIVMIRAQYPRGRGARGDAARVAVARGLRVAGVVTILCGLAAIPLTEWGLGRYGPWAYTLAGSVIVGGVVFLLFGARKQL